VGWGGGEGDLETYAVNGKIIFKLILKKNNARVWTRLTWLKSGF